MSVEVPIPQQFARYFDAEGKPTTEGLILLLRIKEMLDDHEARLVAGSL